MKAIMKWFVLTGIGVFLSYPVFSQVQLVESISELSSGTSEVTVLTTQAAMTAVSGDLYLATVTGKDVRAVSSISGMGLNWERVRSQCTGRNKAWLEVWKAQGTPQGGDGPVTVTLTAKSSGVIVFVNRYTGVDPSGIGNIVSANTNGIDGTCSGGVDNASYSFPISTSTTAEVVFSAATIRSKTHTEGSGFTQIQEINHEETAGIATQQLVLSPGQTSATVSGSMSGDVDWSVIAFTIKGNGGNVTQYTLTTNVIGNGSIVDSLGNPPAGLYDVGTQLTLTAVPDGGYQFSGWSEDLSGTNPSQLVTMNNNVSVTATFTELLPNQYSLNVVPEPDGGGIVSLSPSGGIYNENTVVTVEAVPASGYVFTNWSGDVTGEVDSVAVTMNANKSITANFALDTGSGGESVWSQNGSGVIYYNNGSVGIGTSNPLNYKLAVEGKVGAHEIVVTMEGWSDFVFEEGYQLPTLEEIEAFIAANKHLPEIPSQAEVSEKGVNVGEMHARLLQKIEELTLYLIHMNKENQTLKARVSEIEQKTK